MQKVNSIKEELKNQMGTVNDKTLAKAYLELAWAHEELKRKHEAQQNILEKTKQEMERLRSISHEKLAKLTKTLRHHKHLFKKYRADVVRILTNTSIPIIDRIKNSGLDVFQNLGVTSLEYSINDILFITLNWRKNWRPKEIEVAGLIKEGKKTKEIAERIGYSVSGAQKCRQRISEKLGIAQGKSIHVKAYLIDQEREIEKRYLKNDDMEKQLMQVLRHQASSFQKYKLDVAHNLKAACDPIFNKLKNSGLDGMQYWDLETLEASINDVLARPSNTKNFEIRIKSA
jgi:hypothetical protein